MSRGLDCRLFNVAVENFIDTGLKIRKIFTWSLLNGRSMTDIVYYIQSKNYNTNINMFTFSSLIFDKNLNFQGCFLFDFRGFLGREKGQTKDDIIFVRDE